MISFSCNWFHGSLVEQDDSEYQNFQNINFGLALLSGIQSDSDVLDIHQIRFAGYPVFGYPENLLSGTSLVVVQAQHVFLPVLHCK